MSSKKINLLLTAAGTQTFANIYTALNDQNDFRFKIVACDIDPLAYGLYLADKSYLIPKASDKKFIPELLKICEKEKIDILIPLLSLEYPKITKEKKRFKKTGVIVPISSHRTVDICMDKKKTYGFFVDNDIPTARSFLPEELPSKLSFPLIVKPRSSSGTKDVYKADNKKELRLFIKKVNKPIVQEYLEGQEYTIDVLSDWDSSPIAIVPRTRLETTDGKSTKGLTVKNKKITDYSKKIISKLNLIGPSNIQGFMDGDTFKFTEINPRFSAGGLPLAIAAGINTPLLLVKLALGEKLSGPLRYKENTYMLRFFSEVIVDKKKVLKK